MACFIFAVALLMFTNLLGYTYGFRPYTSSRSVVVALRPSKVFLMNDSIESQIEKLEKKIDKIEEGVTALNNKFTAIFYSILAIYGIVIIITSAVQVRDYFHIY